MMKRIALATEVHFSGKPHLAQPDKLPEGLLPVTQAVVRGANAIGLELSAKLIVAASRTGVTALALSKLRGAIPTIGVSDSEATLRQMCLYWGVTPLAGVNAKDFLQITEHVSRWGLLQGRLKPGDKLVLVAGHGMGTGGHNMAIVHEVQ
jgi:pyruvate kinase